ncbi:MAG: transporter substrate-binding domain-containing protein [Gorillibacterium sp.]|nr:transporter substrate-binding domain-containing protein [Gorillibacterium sp.]
MRKTIVMFFVFILSLTLFGCSTKGDSTTINVATDAAYAPMESMDKDKIVGFDIDFLAEVMKKAGLKYKVTNTGWDTMLESVKTGSEYQLGISSVSITDDRALTYDYTVPYFESTNMIMVKEGSEIKTALDLKDKKVAVQNGTTADELMSEIMGASNSKLSKYDSNVLALMELDKGGVDAVVADIAIVREYMKNNPTKKFVGLLDTVNFGAEYYGILLPKGSELKAKLDPAIKALVEDGTYTTVYEKWFGEKPDTAKLLEAANK